jgi:hypothetical protein
MKYPAVRLLPSFVALAAALLAPCAATAQSVFLNFGTTVNNADTNTPGTVVGGVTPSAWNLITDDTAGGIVTATGGASSVTVNLGKTVGASSTVLDWSATGFSNSALGTQQSTGIYAGNTRSATFVNDGATSNIELGARIGGLAAGTYTAYIVARNTSGSYAPPTVPVYSYNLFFGTVTSASGNTDFGSIGASVITNDSIGTSWVAGTTYQSYTFTIAAGQDLVVISQGFNNTTANLRGFLNTIEITAIPEPSAYAAFLGLGALGLAALRRRRGRS